MSHFEVYILNYNGSRFLPDCLTALRQLLLGSHTLGVNVVDNGSSDNSEALMKDQFPEFRFIPLEKNYGFSKGNNLGVKRAKKKADFNVFLNNDTAVDKNWIVEAAAAFASDDQIGIVGSKSLFMDRFVELRLKTAELFRPSDHGGADTRVLGAFLKSLPSGATVVSDPKRMKVMGAYGPEQNGRWLSPEARILVPVTAESGVLSLEEPDFTSIRVS